MSNESGSQSDHWRRVNELFHLALERPPLERAAFIDKATGSDEIVRREVRSLLAAHSQGGRLLDSETVSIRSGGGSAAFEDVRDRMVGPYRLERVLGQGGMGVVFLAEDTRLGRRVALKAISPDYTHDMARRERLRREARAAAALAHPGIATIYALEEVGDEMFIAAEYVAGETLREEISRGSGTPRRVLDTSIGLATALAAAHDRGIIHRDLKPENIIRTPDGSVKILDFGLAQMRSATSTELRLTADGTVIGTPAYMAPEQIRRNETDARADLFSLGILLFEFLSGAHPFSGDDAAATIARILESTPPPIPTAAIVADSDRRLAADLEAVIRVCLSKSPEGRFASAHALLGALERLRDGRSGVRPLVMNDTASAMKWWRFHQAATSAAYAGLMVPLWLARGAIGGKPGLLTFLAGLVGAVGAIVLRLHLWFAASSLPEEWQAQRDGSRWWLLATELLFVFVLAGAGFGVLDSSAPLSALLVGAAVVVLVSFAVIEPATTRAAFRSH